jgi:hypothetical protein
LRFHASLYGYARSLCGGPTLIRLTFPLAEVADFAQASLGDLLRGVGKVFIENVMESELAKLLGGTPAANFDKFFSKRLSCIELGIAQSLSALGESHNFLRSAGHPRNSRGQH